MQEPWDGPGGPKCPPAHEYGMWRCTATLAAATTAAPFPAPAGGGGATWPESASFVIGPTMPSTASPCAVWKPRTAASVAAPKIPSTARLAPPALRRPCSAETQAPVAPRCSGPQSARRFTGGGGAGRPPDVSGA